MPIFYFHVRAGNLMIHDEEGLDVPHLDDAREEALQSARDLLSAGDLAGEDRRDWAVLVADASGHIVLTLPLSHSVRAPKSSFA